MDMELLVRTSLPQRFASLSLEQGVLQGRTLPFCFVSRREPAELEPLGAHPRTERIHFMLNAYLSHGGSSVGKSRDSN